MTVNRKAQLSQEVIANLANLKTTARRKLIARLLYLSTKRITQKEIAQELGVDESTISRDVHSKAYRDECESLRETLKAHIFTRAWQIVDLDGLQSPNRKERLATARWLIERFRLNVQLDELPPWEVPGGGDI